MSPKQGLAFVKRHGIVLQAARGPVPSLAETIAGGPIRGSWWGHAKGHEIFRVAEAVSESPDVLVCRLVNGKVTYVHRRLWPALVKLAARFGKARLAQTRNEHTATGAHRTRRTAFPEWVPREVLRQAARMSIQDAEQVLSPWLALGEGRPGRVLRAMPPNDESDASSRHVLALPAESSAQDQEWPMPKDKEKARAEGFKRGVDGKRDAAGLTQGWTDDKGSSIARSEGWVAGKRKRSQLEAEAARKRAKK